LASYKLTKAAGEDLENIFEFGIDTFGLDQAVKYQIRMSQRFGELAEQPELYSAVDHIRRGYRRCVFGPHSIYYRIEPMRVLIVRILGRQDPPKALLNAGPTKW
jgi:toxin ParE1/3/4